VVLKVGRADLDVEEFRVLARAEALYTARLAAHPAFAQYLGNLTIEDRQVIILRYCPGGTVGDLLERNPDLDVIRGLDLAIAVCRGLEFSSRIGIILSDLNVHQLLLDDDRATVTISDPGIARLSPGATGGFGGADLALLHRADAICRALDIGTYEFMAPARAARPDLPDVSWDLFGGIGCLLFNLLVGPRASHREVIGLKEGDPALAHAEMPSIETALRFYARSHRRPRRFRAAEYVHQELCGRRTLRDATSTRLALEWARQEEIQRDRLAEHARRLKAELEGTRGRRNQRRLRAEIARLEVPYAYR
jgi:serine/threonine protein kinase